MSLCARPAAVHWGTHWLSGELDEAPLGGKTVVVIGSGASGVEAVETALAKGAKHCVMLARDDKVRTLS